MQILKLVLPLCGLLMAGQALAHKASHTLTEAAPGTRLTPAQTDTNPAALLGGMGGHGMQGLSVLPASTSPEATPKSTLPVTRINRRH